jgi:hypothetical protein
MKMLHQSHCSHVVTLCHISRRLSPEKKYIRFGRSGHKNYEMFWNIVAARQCQQGGWQWQLAKKNSHFKLRRTGPTVTGITAHPDLEHYVGASNNLSRRQQQDFKEK